MSDELHIGHEAVRILQGDEKIESLKLAQAEGQTFAPKHQEILNHNVQGNAKTSRHEIHLDGAKLYLAQLRGNRVFNVSLKKKTIGFRHQPKFVGFHGNEAVIVFDKRRSKLFMGWLRMFAAVVPMRFMFSNDPTRNLMVCRMPAPAARLFLTPALNNG